MLKKNNPRNTAECYNQFPEHDHINYGYFRIRDTVGTWLGLGRDRHRVRIGYQTRLRLRQINVVSQLNYTPNVANLKLAIYVNVTYSIRSPM